MEVPKNMNTLLKLLGVKILDKTDQDKIKEKLNMIVDTKVKKILKDKYGITESNTINTSSTSNDGDWSASVSAYAKTLNELKKTDKIPADKKIDKNIYKWRK